MLLAAAPLPLSVGSLSGNSKSFPRTTSCSVEWLCPWKGTLTQETNVGASREAYVHPLCPDCLGIFVKHQARLNHPLQVPFPQCFQLRWATRDIPVGMESRSEHNSHPVPYQVGSPPWGGTAPALQLPHLPLDFPLASFSMCCRTMTSSREAMRTDVAFSQSLGVPMWAPACPCAPCFTSIFPGWLPVLWTLSSNIRGPKVKIAALQRLYNNHNCITSNPCNKYIHSYLYL